MKSISPDPVELDESVRDNSKRIVADQRRVNSTAPLFMRVSKVETFWGGKQMPVAEAGCIKQSLIIAPTAGEQQ